MDNIILEKTYGFIEKVFGIFDEDNLCLDGLDEELLREAKNFSAEILGLYVETVDKGIVQDKRGRKTTGYVVERYGDERKIETAVGEVVFKRTYFYNPKAEKYGYLADQAVGLEKGVRLTEGLALSTVKAAQEMSYERASKYVTAGAISRQTVMQKVRESEAKSAAYPDIKKRVKNLHIDADEDHVTLVGGRNTIVPLISVYEGIERVGKRGICKSIFHVSEYGKKSSDLWEQVLTEIENRYELEDTKIYIHGDGAGWIQEAREWFPKAIFVLDKYHKNKYIKQLTAGLEQEQRKKFEIAIRQALNNEDVAYYDNLVKGILSQVPEREELIVESGSYLKQHMGSISICKQDKEANNGGATEPHVSHVLSNRLSNRPMAWSKQTLKQMAPMLASKQNGVEAKKKSNTVLAPCQKTAVKKAKKLFNKQTLGLPLPEAIGSFTVNAIGKRTQLAKALNYFK